jgi:hypothetical protein
MCGGGLISGIVVGPLYICELEYMYVGSIITSSGATAITPLQRDLVSNPIYVFRQ